MLTHTQKCNDQTITWITLKLGYVALSTIVNLNVVN